MDIGRRNIIPMNVYWEENLPFDGRIPYSDIKLNEEKWYRGRTDCVSFASCFVHDLKTLVDCEKKLEDII